MSVTRVNREELQFHYVYGRCIVAWNHAEQELRELVTRISGDSLVTRAVVTHLDSLPLQRALLTLADAYEGYGIKEHLDHLADGIEILRPFRNSYVHDFIGVEVKDGKAIGHFLAIEAKKVFQISRMQAPVGELVTFLSSAQELRGYAEAIKSNFPARPLNRLLNLEPEPVPPPASLQKPTWPPRLNKNRQRLQAHRILQTA